MVSDCHIAYRDSSSNQCPTLSTFFIASPDDSAFNGDHGLRNDRSNSLSFTHQHITGCLQRSICSSKDGGDGDLEESQCSHYIRPPSQDGESQSLERSTPCRLPIKMPTYVGSSNESPILEFSLVSMEGKSFSFKPSRLVSDNYSAWWQHIYTPKDYTFSCMYR